MLSVRFRGGSRDLALVQGLCRTSGSQRSRGIIAGPRMWNLPGAMWVTHCLHSLGPGWPAGGDANALILDFSCDDDLAFAVTSSGSLA